MEDLAVYVHFPWCLRKCPYCDFATSPRARDEVEHDAYAEAVLRELAFRAPELEKRRLCSVFFGGGTPSLWRPSALGSVLSAIRERAGAEASDLEVTVECNPSSLDEAGAHALCVQGVNRFSVGVQSLDDAELRFLGRLHDRQQALAALSAARTTGARVSADLMFALPKQTSESVAAQLDELLALGLEHLSAYALTIEAATPFGADLRKGRLKPAPDELYALLFESIEDHLGQRGLSHYEVSNYARCGQESRHNQHYWRGAQYLGLGAAAVGCLAAPAGARRYRNHPDAVRYMQRASSSQVEVFAEALGPEDLIREAFMLGLRTREGVCLASLGERVGRDPRVGRAATLAKRLAAGDLVLEGTRLRVPLACWLRLDGIVADLF